MAENEQSRQNPADENILASIASATGFYFIFLHCSSLVGKKTGCSGVAPSYLNNTVWLAHVDE